MGFNSAFKGLKREDDSLCCNPELSVLPAAKWRLLRDVTQPYPSNISSLLFYFVVLSAFRNNPLPYKPGNTVMK